MAGKKRARSPRRKWPRLAALAYVCLLLLAVNLSTGRAGAWLFGSNAADNTFLTPELTVFVDESNDGNTYGEWTPQNIDWGASVDKYVRFTNTGESAVVLRASFAQQWTAANGGETVFLNNLYKTNGSYTAVAQPEWTADGFGNASLWYDGGDGWYYYRQPLAPGESTQTVLESVRFVSPAPAGYAAADYSLAFVAEACQYSENPDNENQQAVWLSFNKTYAESGGTLTWSSSAP